VYKECRQAGPYMNMAGRKDSGGQEAVLYVVCMRHRVTGDSGEEYICETWRTEEIQESGGSSICEA
jgi:hypothetical protein